MPFYLIDRIVDLAPGERIRATKSLSLADNYLQDHFPKFPVMPGVLMLEAMYQTSAWLVRLTDGFAHSMITLREARNVKYADFVRPGQTLTVEAQWAKADVESVTLKVSGSVNGVDTAVSARLILERYNLSARGLGSELDDRYILRGFREQLGLLWPQGAADAAPA